MSYKMIVLDIDGTLTNKEKEITPRTKTILKKAQEQGIILALASGRPIIGLRKFSHELELDSHHGLLLAYNGGRVIDAQTDQLLYEKLIPLDQATTLLKHFEQFPVTPMVTDDSYLYVSDINGYKVDYEKSINGLPVKEVSCLSETLNFSPVKVLLSAPNDILLSIMDEIRKPYEEEYSFIMSESFFLECNMKGISKGSSLARICHQMQIKPEEVIAFGDAPNDLSTIKFAGLGVAMGNACQELKDIANEITLTNNEDGVAVILEKYI